ncbi:MAG: MBL fold metallo-hydrolase [Candidatus Magasanikbacteria bacterium CG10_big_fil_rev_8_21_14_0_10_40_10]|uniref:MBL fold metallo-hydrolase n=1 Tax=Candidatus Magasanikbacteria bacterium CG10_big_fil_rev_8_21_14_0_10_40_10 TaxID=1974648 RepID=A0A2M6W516_9BACT|nr:MAG: MBL fold metallo-hydrolase [Candidatus Magasanikbacteria bacterium CG10_big_fil_rev_8_21_14_0_10_40_10]
MQISFHGATGEVTGSCSLLEAGEEKIIVDCGLFQGGEELDAQNFEPFKFDPMSIDGVIVTHAHLDHVGRLPLLVKSGFNKNIYSTPATAKLAELILRDALMVMEENYRRLGYPVLYDESDVSGAIALFKPVDYGQKQSIGRFEFVFHDAGHIFGSAFVEIKADGKKIVFSGDIGNTDMPILRETENLPDNLDLVVCESTYGARRHEAHTNAQREKIIETIILRSVKRGGVLMVPSFALERTQQLLYVLNELIDRKKLLPQMPIFLDSPLAIEATKIYRQYPKYYNQAARDLYKTDKDLFDFKCLRVTETIDESKKINHTPGSKIIIAGAGMMNGGRILHHALRYISDSSNTLLFIGYQARGTLGRKILEGVSQVKIFAERVPVNCHLEAMGALSAHADGDKIIDWLSGAQFAPKKVIFNHGEIPQAEVIALRVAKEIKIKASIADSETNIEV